MKRLIDFETLQKSCGCTTCKHITFYQDLDKKWFCDAREKHCPIWQSLEVPDFEKRRQIAYDEINNMCKCGMCNESLESRNRALFILERDED